MVLGLVDTRFANLLHQSPEPLFWQALVFRDLRTRCLENLVVKHGQNLRFRWRERADVVLNLQDALRVECGLLVCSDKKAGSEFGERVWREVALQAKQFHDTPHVLLVAFRLQRVPVTAY